VRTSIYGWAGAALLLALVAGCAAERLHRDGMAAIDRGDYEQGVADLQQALAKDPGNIAYKLDYEARRDSAVQKLIGLADSARGVGQFDLAVADYQRALAIDPSNIRAQKGIENIEGDKRHGAALASAREDFERKDYAGADAKLHSILNEDPTYGPAQELRAAINIARGSTTVAPRLKTRDNRKVSLQLRDAPTKMAFEVLQRETGINFILDKDVKSDGKTTIFVQEVPVDEAIDLVLDQNGLARQILASNMVMIYPNNPAKQKEYEQQIVRTFYVSNAEPKEVESMLKSILGAKNLFTDERSNSVTIRDTPDAVRMAEKMVASLDVVEPEVMLEIEILEMTSSKLQDLGILYPGMATLSPTSLAAGGTGSTSLSLYDLFHQNSQTIQVSPLSVTLNAMKVAGLTNTLASPRIRTRNKEKAKILIGSRLPVITNSVTPTSAGPPVVTGTVQYLDVGLMLEVQPAVHRDGDVGVKISLEVSNLIKQVTTASGTVAYEIGTRNANTMLRLKDGETQILAGLVQDSDVHAANTVPGLGDIPILGKLFGTNHTDREKDEIVLSITPHIVRMQTRPPSDDTEFWYGSEARTRSSPYTSSAGAVNQGGGAASRPMPPPAPMPQAPAGVEPVSPSVPAGDVSAPLGNNEPPAVDARFAPAATSAPYVPVGATATPAPQGLATAIVPVPIASAGAPSAAAGAAATGRAAPTASARSALNLEGPKDAKVGDEFQVVLQLSSEQGITRLRSQLRFDASALQLISATVGDIVPAAANGPSVDTKGGGAQLDVVASPEDPVQGSGSLMVVRFKALAPRPATNIAAMVNVLGGTGAAIGSSAAQPLLIAIR
jgi:general secretion pathway protein D